MPLVWTRKAHRCNLCGRTIPARSQAMSFRIPDPTTQTKRRVHYCPLFGCYTDPETPVSPTQPTR